MNPTGILILDKPDGPTSHDCVNRLRRIYGVKRIGHTGTLDPFATGVLVMLIGKATRLARFFNEDDKRYEALVSWGSATDTGDRTGQITDSCDAPLPDESEILAAMKGMTGEIQQVPPMYSAAKIDGKALYKIARKGKEVQRKPKTIYIRELKLIRRFECGFKVSVTCSKGAYIRTLAEDLAKKLGGFGHLKELRRVASGDLTLEKSHKLDDLLEAYKDEGSREYFNKILMPMSIACAKYTAFKADALLEQAVINGKQPSMDDLSGGPAVPNSIIRIIDDAGELLAMAQIDAEGRAAKLLMVLKSADENF